jgi:hypothetical protein
MKLRVGAVITGALVYSTTTYVFLASVALGQDAMVTVGAESLDLPPPVGFCLMEETQPADGRILGMLRFSQKDQNALLLGFADCRELLGWRSGQVADLDNYGYVLTPFSVANSDLSGRFDDVLDEIRTAMPIGDATDSEMDPINEAVSQYLTGPARVESFSFLGMLEENKRAFHAAAVTTATSESGDSETSVAVFTGLLVRGKLIYSYLWAPIGSRPEQTLATLLDQQKGLAAAWTRLNND